jgi:transcriptional regulator with XRE-family HTH domain
MRPLSNAAGEMLRTLRSERGLTLELAAGLVGSSIASLSRKERGVDGMDRDFLRRAIAGYGLSPWEAHRLWTTAGYTTDSAVTNALPGDLRSFATQLLTGCPYPAIITDDLGYILAWNQADEFMWQPSAGGRRPHVVSALFTPQVRAHLGEQWESTARRRLEAFYAQTLPIARRPDFRALLAELRAKLGQPFEEFWRAAQQGAHNAPAADGAGYTGALDVGEETAEYVVAQTTFDAPIRCTLSLYLPLGARSAAIYARLRAGMGQNAVHFAAAV